MAEKRDCEMVIRNVKRNKSGQGGRGEEGVASSFSRWAGHLLDQVLFQQRPEGNSSRRRPCSRGNSNSSHSRVFLSSPHNPYLALGYQRLRG